MLITDKARCDCCLSCSQGELELQASTDKISYLSNEKCRLTVKMDAKNLKTSVSKLVIQLTASINLTSGSGYARNFDGCAYKWE